MSERLFSCEPTDRERAKIRTTNRGAQGALFNAPQIIVVACPACAGIGDGCTCSESGAEALGLFGDA